MIGHAAHGASPARRGRRVPGEYVGLAVALVLLVGAFGLTGAMLIVALLLGLLLGGVLIGVKHWRARNQPHHDPGAEIHISPYA